MRASWVGSACDESNSRALDVKWHALTAKKQDIPEGVEEALPVYRGILPTTRISLCRIVSSVRLILPIALYTIGLPSCATRWKERWGRIDADCALLLCDRSWDANGKCCI
jgi:hypothetical protein